MFLKKTTAVVLALIMLATSAYAVTTTTVSDVAGHWAEQTVIACKDIGILSGYPDGSFKPDNAVTRAEFVKMIDNVFGLPASTEDPFLDVDPGDWFADAVNGAYASGLAIGDQGEFRPNDNITRQEAAVILARAFKLEATTTNAYYKFSDMTAVATWSADAINALVEKGYMEGRGNNELAPIANLTRAESATLIENIAGTFVNEVQPVTGDYLGNMVINTAGVTVKDATISGDLYIAQGVGEGDITLDNVQVDGRLVVLGGGTNSIHLFNSIVRQLVVRRFEAPVRIVTDANSTVTNSTIETPCLLVAPPSVPVFKSVIIKPMINKMTIDLEGIFDKVNVSAPKLSEITPVAELVPVKINIPLGSIISTLTMAAATEIKGAGTITEAKVNTIESIISAIIPKTVTTELTDEAVAVTVVDESGNETEVLTPEEPTTSTPTSTSTPSSSVTYKTLKFDAAVTTGGSSTEAISVYAPSTSNYSVILKKLLTGIKGNYETLYSSYASGSGDPYSLIFFSSLSVLTAATTENLAGTVFSELNTSQADKDVIYDALLIAIANADSTTEVATLKSDLATIAGRVALADITYGEPARQFKSIEVKEGSTVIASYAEGGDKAAFINGVYDSFDNWTMSSSITYTVTAVLSDDSTKVGTLTLSTP